MRASLFGVFFLLMVGCANGSSYPGDLPYRSWRLGFLVPDYMEVWVETADVEDIQGRVFRHVGSGTASVGRRGLQSESARGWRNAWGKGRYVDGADLPQRVYVRWQSLVEPQTYKVTLDIPERARQLMTQKVSPPCQVMEYPQSLTLGLAPGGVVRGWVTGVCGERMEVLHAQAEIEPKGPYEGMSNGNHRPLSESSKAYIDQHGIPYGSW